MLTAKGKVYACGAYLISINQRSYIESLIDTVYNQFAIDIQNSNFLEVKNAVLFFAECTNFEVIHVFTFLSLLNIMIK